MANTINSNTFQTTYYDDFDPTDNYYRILFNGGRAVQARELTQLQTIIQKQLERQGNYFFKNGAILNNDGGSLASADTSISYIILQSQPAEFEDLVGRVITKSGTTVSARVKQVLTTVEAGNLHSGSVTAGPTLLIEYLDGSGSTSSSSFQTGTLLSVESAWAGSGNIQVKTTGSNNVGVGSIIEMPNLDMYVNGTFIYVNAQSAVIDPYSTSPNRVIGYTVEEETISVFDDITLYDNSGATPNLASPGADRYRIKLTLTTKPPSNNSTITFIPILEVKKGVLSAVSTQDNQLNRIGKVIADRTNDINGNFISKSGIGTYAVEVGDDSDGDFYQVNISPGVAFIGGNRIEKTNYTTIRIEKPRDAINDTLTTENKTVPFNIGNYFLVDDIGGLGIIDQIGTTTPYIDLLNGSNAKIGQASIIHAEKFYNDTAWNYKIYVTDVLMTASNSISDVRGLAADGSTTRLCTVLPVEGAYSLQDRNTQGLIVPLSGRIKSVSSVTADIARTTNTLTAGSGGGFPSGTIAFSTAGDPATEADEWIIVNTTDDTVDNSYTVTGIGTTSVSISGLTDGKVYHVLYYTRSTLNFRTMTHETNQNETISASEWSSPGVGYFTGAGVPSKVTKIHSITDDVTGEDVSHKFRYVHNSTDNVIKPSYLELKTGYTQTNNITVNHDRYRIDLNDGEIGVANSYGSFAYENVPNYRSISGAVYNLNNIMDFRVTLGNNAISWTGYPGVPRNNSLIEFNKVEYLPRVDVIYLLANGVFGVSQGSSQSGEKPSIPSDAMELVTIYVNPYMISKKDHRLVRANNTGYKMSAIRDLERRISNLEEISTLTLTELSVKDLSVKDENGNDRYKLGLTVDKFELNSQADLTNYEQRAIIEKQTQSIRPVTVVRDLAFNYDSDLSTNTRIYGQVVLPVFTEEEYLSQLQVSDTININQFSLNKYLGSAKIIPATSTFNRSLKVTNVEGDAEVTRIASLGNQLETVDPYWKRLGYVSYQAFLEDRLL